jgi:DNA-binding beta-propeller fold protein YncE
MNRRLRVVAVGAVTLLASIGTAASASAAGAPTKGALGYGADPYTGVVDPEGGDRYTAIGMKSGTFVQRINTANGQIERSKLLDGQLAIPAVAYDGSPGGLSADGDTLVLAEVAFRFPQSDSVFPVIDTNRLRIVDTVTLDGTWTYDALSPDGRWLYLIEYTSPRDITQYEVRRYDLERGRLDPKPIVDPEESSEEMYGSPMTRATSPDGRWAYTLYDGAEHPFIHALDTERGEAVCIDLDPGAVPPRRLFRMTLDPSPDGSTLTVTDPKEGPVAIVDTKSFDVTQPAVAPPADSGGDDSGGAPWLAIGLGALGLAATSLAVVRWRRRAGRVDSDDLEQLVRVDHGSEAKAAPETQEEERDWHRVS